MLAKLYKLKNSFATHNNLLIYFSAVQLFETQKAVYLYGHGTTETTKMGVCCACGRTLTHPVSVELGIGPECGKHFHDWDRIGGYTKENIERLKGAMINVIFDHWVPKSMIEETFPTNDIVVVPVDHPMIKRMQETLQVNAETKTENNMVTGNFREGSPGNDKPTRYCEVIDGKSNYALQVIKIVFPFKYEDVDRVKTLVERRFISDGKYWVCKYDLDNAEKLKSWGFRLSTHLETQLKIRDTIPVKIEDVPKIEIPGLQGELFPFQNKGVSFIESKGGRALIADEMGLGKTVQALAYLQLHPELRPAIIVVPASLKLNWMREADKWMQKPECEILSGTTPYKTHGKILIINYDILTNWVPVLKSKNANVLIMDEIHSIKNSTAKRTKAVKQLAKGIDHVLGLSGTPIVNRPIEAYNALAIINSLALPNFKQFTMRYCGAKHNGFGWDFTGATNTDELHRLLIGSFMIRRKKADVLKDLPDKLKAFVPMQLTNAEEYQQAENDFISYLTHTKGMAAAERASNAETLVRIEALKQLSVRGKIDQVVDWVEAFLEGSDQKLVIFAVHKETIEWLIGAYYKIAVKVDGSVSMLERQNAVDKFQNDPTCRIFIGNIQAAGVGLTLTASSNVAFIELPWTPGALVQAEDRCHRIGQKDSVTIHYLLATGTIEEKIAHLLDSKRKILDSVLDGEKTAQTSLLTELMKEYV